MPKPKGISVTLYQKASTTVDAFNAPVYTETAVAVNNVLVSPVEDGGTEKTDMLNLHGRSGKYLLAIPKGDTNAWENNRVVFFGESWKVIGMPTQGIDNMIPLAWNKQVLVERIE